MTKEQLKSMSLFQLRNIDIKTIEEEKLVQEVVNEKLQTAPIERTLDRHDVPDITTKEEEEHWQKIINEREAELRPKAEITVEEIKEPELTPSESVPEPEVTLEEALENSEPVKEEVPVAEKRFCEFCDSRGVRHKKDCTRQIA